MLHQAIPQPKPLYIYALNTLWNDDSFESRRSNVSFLIRAPWPYFSSWLRAGILLAPFTQHVPKDGLASRESCFSRNSSLGGFNDDSRRLPQYFQTGAVGINHLEHCKTIDSLASIYNRKPSIIFTHVLTIHSLCSCNSVNVLPMFLSLSDLNIWWVLRRFFVSSPPIRNWDEYCPVPIKNQWIIVIARNLLNLSCEVNRSWLGKIQLR